jgi:hypothetical protein
VDQLQRMPVARAPSLLEFGPERSRPNEALLDGHGQQADRRTAQGHAAGREQGCRRHALPATSRIERVGNRSARPV